MSQKIVQRTIEKLTAPDAGNRIVWDSEIKGFGVRITAAGVVSFVLDYRIHGRQRRYTIGKHPEWTATAARKKAGDLKTGIDGGHDPLEEREADRTQPTVGELATDYLERYAEKNKRPSSLRNDRAMLDSIIRPHIGALRLAAVGKRDIEALHASLKATPYQANRVLALLSKMFSLAIDWGWRADNPAKGIERFHEDRRERWLSADELIQFTRAVDAYRDQNAANALRLLLLTGSRAGEVLKAEWTQFDLERGVWTKPSHHTKQKKIEHVPLSAPARELLNAMKPKGATGPLFLGRDGSKARVSLKHPWIQACKAAGLAEAIAYQGKRGKLLTRYKPTVRIHDLRHSYASHLVSNGVSLQIVGKLLGHTQPQTTQRYAHLSDGALRDATNRFGEIFTTATARQTPAAVETQQAEPQQSEEAVWLETRSGGKETYELTQDEILEQVKEKPIGTSDDPEFDYFVKALWDIHQREGYFNKVLGDVEGLISRFRQTTGGVPEVIHPLCVALKQRAERLLSLPSYPETAEDIAALADFAELNKVLFSSVVPFTKVECAKFGEALNKVGASYTVTQKILKQHRQRRSGRRGNPLSGLAALRAQHSGRTLSEIVDRLCQCGKHDGGNPAHDSHCVDAMRQRIKAAEALYKKYS